MDDLRTYLEQREAELLGLMEKLRQEITDRQLLLRPLEAELGEIRRCRATVEPTGGIDHPSLNLPGGVGVPHTGSGIGETIERSDTPLAPRMSTATVPGSGVVAYGDLTLKQLVLKALGQHFPAHGATRSELVEFFLRAWGREVQPNSLSPQLSRLQSDGLIAYRDTDSRWELTSDGAVLALPIGVFEGKGSFKVG